MNPEVIHTSNFVQDAALLIEESGREAVAARKAFRLALSGGNTPAAIYRQLAANGAMAWDALRITFGDERCVPPDDKESNYRMARETLLDAVPIPATNILRMRGELPPPEAAQEYDDELARLAEEANEPRYRHDLLLLGLGPDGHTASLFPGTAALAEESRNVVENFVPKFNTWRITFTYPLINAARHVCFLAGKGKEPVIDQILAGGSGYPAEKIAPAGGRVTWLIDAL